MSEHPGKKAIYELGHRLNSVGDPVIHKGQIAAITAYAAYLEEDVAVLRARLENAEAERDAAYLAGFKDSGEGWNGEYPFEGENPEDDEAWCEIRDKTLKSKS